MAKRLSNYSVNIEADAYAAEFDNGFLRVYSGTRPASADNPLGGAVQLAELGFGSPAFAAAFNGTIIANAIAADPLADATGDAAFYRAFKSDGSTVLEDGDVGGPGSGAAAIIDAVHIVQNFPVNCSSFSHSIPKG